MHNSRRRVVEGSQEQDTMKYLLIAFACFAVLSSVSCGASHELLDKIKWTHLKAFLKQHHDALQSESSQLEEMCLGVTDKLEEALIFLKKCIDQIDDSLTVCDMIHTSTLNCTAPLVKVVDDCLPQKSKGLPALGFKIVVSVSDYLCKQIGESIFELSNPCIWEGLDKSTEDSCNKQLESMVGKHLKEQSLPSKREVCAVLTGLTSCVQIRSTLSCKNSITKAAFLGFKETVTAPCRGGSLSGLTSFKPILAMLKPGNPLNSIF